MTPVRHHVELGSTNAEAMRLALAGEALPLWVVAERQTGGRGRSGRPWVSAPGNLFASYVFVTSAPVSLAHQLSLVAGVAVFDAIAGTGLLRHPALRLKWPNDILAEGTKLGGILVESTMLPESGIGAARLAAVIGIGLNLASHPELDDRPATHLAARGVDLDPAAALQLLDGALTQALALWNAGAGFPAIRDAWTERAGPVGEPVSVHAGAERVSGRYAGLDTDGALLLDFEDGERRRCTYGDVTIG